MNPRTPRTAMLVLSAAALLSACNGGSDDGARAAEPHAPATTASITASYPHDRDAFTQGFLYHEGFFYESTGRNGQSSLRKEEPATGRVVQKVDVAQQYFAEGLALLNNRLYQLTWQNQMGFVYDLGTFAQQSTFPYTGEGWGLTSDGTSLILSDGSNQIRFLDPATYAVKRTIDVMDGGDYVNDINELEWVKGEIWANVWHTDRIARIDPQTGRVRAWIDLVGLYSPEQRGDAEAVLNGIAYDAAGDRLFVTGKLWPNVYQVSVPGVAGNGAAAAP